MNLEQLENGDEISIVLESEEILEDAEIVGREYVDPDGYRAGYLHLTIEGDWWEQVNDRVENEVLRIHQKSTRSGRWKDAKVVGTVWEGGAVKEPTWEEIGIISEIRQG